MPGPRRVLVVDDNADCRDSLRMLLECHGHQVEGAEDGVEGAAKAFAWRPDVAVVDIDMPVRDGYGMAQRVRQAMGAAVRLIAVTGRGGRVEALAAGFDEYLVKPADPATLLRLVGGAN